jgi:hypothetical protein
LCEAFHQLPYTGGLLEQPYTVVLKIEKVKLADVEVEEAEDKTSEAKAKAEERVKEKYGPKSA